MKGRKKNTEINELSFIFDIKNIFLFCSKFEWKSMSIFSSLSSSPYVSSYVFANLSLGIDNGMGCLAKLPIENIKEICQLLSPLEDPWEPSSFKINVDENRISYRTFKVVVRALDYCIATTRGSEMTLYVQLLFQHCLLVMITPGTKPNISSVIMKCLTCKNMLKGKENDTENCENDGNKQLSKYGIISTEEEEEEEEDSDTVNRSSSSDSEYNDIWSSHCDDSENNNMNEEKQ